MRKYYIFDLDGTLADSMGYWYGSFTEDELYDEQKMTDVRHLMRDNYERVILLKPCARELLEYLRDKDVKMCIASATDSWVSKPFLEKYRLNELFEFYIDCTEAGAAKDRPDIYLAAAERLGAEPSECVVAEDSAYCAETAKRAGFYVVGLYDKNTAPNGDVREYSDVFFESLSEWLGALKDGELDI